MNTKLQNQNLEMQIHDEGESAIPNEQNGFWLWLPK